MGKKSLFFEEINNRDNALENMIQKKMRKRVNTVPGYVFNWQ